MAKREWIRYVDTAIGVVLTACLAMLGCVLFYNSTWRRVLPIGFILAVLMVAKYFGRMAGVLGSIASALLFATFLFAPLGSVRVSNLHARDSLQWLLLAGISLSFLFSGGAEPDR